LVNKERDEEKGETRTPKKLSCMHHLHTPRLRQVLVR
jgi:hypothetical protein